jgi:hypothetical protein
MSQITGGAVMMTGPNYKVDAAIVSLICLLPPEITQLWWDTATLSGCLRRAGITGIMLARLRKALFTTQPLTPAMPWKCRLWKNTCYYLFGKAMEDFTPKTQFNHFLPTIDKNHFLRNTRASGKFLEGIKTAEPALLPHFYKTRSTAVSHEKSNKESNTEGCERDSDVEEGENEVDPPSLKGYKIVSIEQEAKFLDSLQEHAMSCQCKMNHVIASNKCGFEVKEFYECRRCKQTTRSTAVSHEKSNKESNTEGCERDSDVEEGENEVDPPTLKGYKIVSIEQEAKFLDALQEHAMSCQFKMNHVIASNKCGFEVKDFMNAEGASRQSSIE